MVEQRLLQYVEQRVREGYTEAQIAAALREQGHTEREIGAALRHPTHRSASKMPLIIVGLVLLGVLGFLLFRPESAIEPPEPRPLPPPSNSVVELAAELQLEGAALSADQLYFRTVEVALERTTSPSDGILICSVNRDIIYKQYCLQELAKQEGSAAYCDIIGELDQRDECYLTLVLKGEDQYCTNLVLEENQHVCDVLLGEL